ncbi:hypothetical protein FQN51_004444, partial [Onygenales sp. PD_10]
MTKPRECRCNDAGVSNTNSVVTIMVIIVNITWSAGSTHGGEHIRIFHGGQTRSSTSTRAIFSFPIRLDPEALINLLVALLTDCAGQNGSNTVRLFRARECSGAGG